MAIGSRAVVDTNIWVSAVLNPAGPPARVLEAFTDGRFTLVASKPLLDELSRVLSRPRLARRYKIEPDDVEELVGLLRMRAIIVDPPGHLQICRDPHDDVVIETAAIGHADVVVTRDDDLKGATEVVELLGGLGITVLSVRRFLSELAERAG